MTEEQTKRIEDEIAALRESVYELRHALREALTSYEVGEALRAVVRIADTLDDATDDNGAWIILGDVDTWEQNL